MSRALRPLSLRCPAYPISHPFPTWLLKSRVPSSASVVRSDELAHRLDSHEQNFGRLSTEFPVKNHVTIVKEIPRSLDSKQRLRIYSSLLHDCARKWLMVEGKSVHGNLIRCEIEWDSYLWVSLVNFYAKSRELNFARQVLVLMPRRDVVAYTALISGYVDEGYGSAAATLFSNMRRDGVRPNEFALPRALKASSLSLDLQFCEQIHQEGFKLGFSLDSVFVSCLIDAYAKCGKIDSARRVFFDMPVNNVVAWNVLLNSYVEMGKEDDLLRLFNGIKNPEIKFNAYTLSTVFKGCANSLNARQAKAVHSVVVRSCSELDNYSSSALVNTYSKCGLASEALNVFRMTTCPDVATWSSIIACLAQNGRTLEMVHLFRQMKLSGVSPNGMTFATVLGASSSNLDYESFGLSIHACVVKHGVTSQIWIGNALVTMYMRYGWMEEGMQAFEEMEVRDVVSWNARLAGYQNTNQGARIFRCMLLHGILPTAYTYISVLVSCSMLLSCMGKQVHSHVVKSGFSGNDQVLTALADMYRKSGCLEDASSCLDMVADKDHHSWTVMIRGYRDTDQPDKAVMCSIEMEYEGVKPNEFILSSCIDACSGMDSVQIGRLLHSMVVKSGSSDDIIIGTSLIDMYGKCGSVEEAESVFKGMGTHDVVMWNAMICVYSRYSLGEKAMEAAMMMVKDGVMPDDITADKVIMAASHDVHLLEKARQLFVSLQELYGPIPAFDPHILNT